MAGASFGLRPLLARGKPLVFPWMGIPGAELAAQVARAGFEAVAIDLQHSTIDMGDAAKMTNAINAVGVPVILRVRWNDPGIIGAALDMGAAAVIAPMTNSVAQVEALVKAAKYPPVGQRSWGGYTMLQAAGVTAGEYLKEANSQTLVFAMIETQEALDNLDAIAAVPGLDGLFVGPSDLSIALSNGAGIDRLGAHTHVSGGKPRHVARGGHEQVGVRAQVLLAANERADGHLCPARIQHRRVLRARPDACARPWEQAVRQPGAQQTCFTVVHIPSRLIAADIGALRS